MTISPRTIRRIIQYPALVKNRLKFEFVKRVRQPAKAYDYYPGAVYLVPTLRCNLDCRICGIRHNLALKNRQPPGTDFTDEMGWNVWQKTIDELAQFKPNVLISGGEPLIFPHILPMIHRLSVRHRIPVSIATNGLLLFELMKHLSSLNLQQIYLSVDGLEDSYNANRGKNNFGRLVRSLESISDFIGKKPMTQVIAVVVITPENQRELTDVIHFLMSYGITTIRIQHLVQVTEKNLEEMKKLTDNPDHRAQWTWGEKMNLEKIDTDNLVRTRKEIRNLVQNDSCLDIAFIPDIADSYLPVFYSNEPAPPKPDFRCPMFRVATSIYPDGSVIGSHICYFSSRGNVREKSFKEIWFSPEYQKIRILISETGWLPACGFCTIPLGGCM